MPTMTVEEAQAQLPQLIDRLAPGEEIVLTRNDRPVARLVASAEAEVVKDTGRISVAPLTVPPTADEDPQDAATFLEQLAEHVRRGQENSALRLIYHSLYQFRRAGRHGVCDQLLREVNVAALSPVLLIGLLTMTAPIKDRLGHRAAFYRAVRDAIREARGAEAAEKTLVGLE